MKHLLLITIAALSYTCKAQTIFTKMDNQKPYTALVLLNATPQWLSLTRDERSIFFEKEVLPIFQKVEKTVKVSFFDSEYFNSTVSDFMIITATNLDDYKLMIELLRDTEIYGIPYFEVKDIIIGQENIFEDFNSKFKRDKG